MEELLDIMLLGGRNWRMFRRTDTSEMWSSEWCSEDGDCATAIITGDGVDVRCISGIPASSFFVDKLDYPSMWRKILTPDNKAMAGPMHEHTFIQQSLMIAEYVCSKFCERAPVMPHPPKDR